MKPYTIVVRELVYYTNPEYADMRIWQVSGFSNYLIFYRVNETDLTVVRILHGARDYDTIFNEE